ncbi:putative membrane protein YczE [Paenibacillus sp. PastF-1]|nr:putative membrane protein YczE [Paenibacillus sp. PastF-2]MDF9848192.1 putative membrane protein YczE [Paenibacillus sp. PastM-2]MDF9854855.1 putative membrane protein YczE [Paenibacillus sp. PastF-1]MDH6480125.1 putative membrane protein YczE [Paenibacillus sp. PastH-2]MDH6507556.1 putative membrane protein YczE [Paenibacillus sp. PastM-3]
MNYMMRYIKSVDPRRLIIMVIGNIFLGMGISIFKLSGMGNDPFSGMVMALADLSFISYANFLILLNVVLFVVEWITGRKFIGAGTFVNAIFLGYIATFFYDIWIDILGEPHVLWQRVITVAIGVVVCSFGVSLYQSSDVGVAPYDALSLIMKIRAPRISYFWHRMFTDALCALICFLAGGIIGLGTLVSAFGLGPIIHFFDVHFTNKLLGKTGAKAGGGPVSL